MKVQPVQNPKEPRYPKAQLPDPEQLLQKSGFDRVTAFARRSALAAAVVILVGTASGCAVRLQGDVASPEGMGGYVSARADGQTTELELGGLPPPPETWMTTAGEPMPHTEVTLAGDVFVPPETCVTDPAPDPQTEPVTTPADTHRPDSPVLTGAGTGPEIRYIGEAPTEYSPVLYYYDLVLALADMAGIADRFDFYVVTEPDAGLDILDLKNRVGVIILFTGETGDNPAGETTVTFQGTEIPCLWVRDSEDTTAVRDNILEFLMNTANAGEQ